MSLLQQSVPCSADIEQTQKYEPVKLNAQLVESEEIVQAKPIFSSSDEEESNENEHENENIKNKSRKKRKQHTLVYSGKKNGCLSGVFRGFYRF